ncbi:MAG: hypothetical protein ACXU8N_08760 [Telluria sp.]
MSRRLVYRIVLSLLLLASQQMAFTHALTHLAGRAQLEASRGKAVNPFAQDQSCEQCLAFAQIAGAPGNETRFFLPPAERAAAALQPCTAAASRRPALPFHSRAPPALA